MSDNSTTRPPSSRIPLPIAAHDITLRRQPGSSGRGTVQATVECPVEVCTKHVEECARCPNFVRIDVHEAGYCMLCHSQVNAEPAAPEPPEPSGS